MRWGRKALEMLVPGSRYVVLTDKESVPFLDPHFEVAVTAPSGIPLMPQCILAQAEFEKRCQDGLTILAAPDCMVSRADIYDSIRHPFVVTYRRDLSINNVGYALDHDLAHWFLMRAHAELMSVPAGKTIYIGGGYPKLLDWGGDQEGWKMALGDPELWEQFPGTKVRAAPLEREVYLYPIGTHNHPIRKTGDPKRGSYYAHLLHFKGDRKCYMHNYVMEYIPHWIEKREREEEEQRRGKRKCVSPLLDTQDTGEKSLLEPSEAPDT